MYALGRVNSDLIDLKNGNNFLSNSRPSAENNRINSTGGYFSPLKFAEESDSAYRKKPSIFKDRVSALSIEGADDIHRELSPSRKTQQTQKPRKTSESTNDDKVDEDGEFDLNDKELIVVIHKENQKFKKEAVPEEEPESSLALKEQVKMHSELPLNVSVKRNMRDSITRANAFGGGSPSSRPTINARMSYTDPAMRGSVMAAGYQNAGVGSEAVLWTIKKPKTDEEEDLEDDRGGFFCGVCTMAKSRKPIYYPPEREHNP